MNSPLTKNGQMRWLQVYDETGGDTYQSKRQKISQTFTNKKREHL
jgi:hypothetical protein